MTQNIERLATLVWDTIAELSYRGETRLDPDSAQCAGLRKTAYAAAGVKTGGDPLLVSGRELGYSVLEWLRSLETSALFKPHPRLTRRTGSSKTSG